MMESSHPIRRVMTYILTARRSKQKKTHTVFAKLTLRVLTFAAPPPRRARLPLLRQLRPQLHRLRPPLALRPQLPKPPLQLPHRRPRQQPPPALRQPQLHRLRPHPPPRQHRPPPPPPPRRKPQLRPQPPRRLQPPQLPRRRQ